MQSINLSRRFYCSRHHQTEVPPCPHWWRNGPRPLWQEIRFKAFQNVESSWNFKCSGTRSISICISLRPLDSMSNMCTSYVLEVCNAAWKGYELQLDCSHPRSVPSRCSRDQASSSDLGHVCTKRSFGSLEFLARHTAPEKCLACGMFKVENYHVCSPFSQEVCWGGFSGCIGSRAQSHENLTTDSKWPVDMTKCNCSDHCSITRPLEGWASAASWSPAMAKGALASGCLESEVKTLVKSWNQKDEN